MVAKLTPRGLQEILQEQIPLETRDSTPALLWLPTRPRSNVGAATRSSKQPT